MSSGARFSTWHVRATSSARSTCPDFSRMITRRFGESDATPESHDGALMKPFQRCKSWGAEGLKFKPSRTAATAVPDASLRPGAPLKVCSSYRIGPSVVTCGSPAQLCRAAANTARFDA